MTKPTKQEVIDRLDEIGREILYRIAEARRLLRPYREAYQRADCYWLAHIEGAIKDGGSMVTLEDTITDLNDSEDDDMTLLPRLVAFDSDGKAIAAGCAAHVANGATTAVCHLPSEHPDFIDCDVRGMTLQEIQARRERLFRTILAKYKRAFSRRGTT